MSLSEVLGSVITGWKAGCHAVKVRRVLVSMRALQRQHCSETVGKRTWPQIFIDSFGIIDHSLKRGSTNPLSLSWFFGSNIEESDEIDTRDGEFRNQGFGDNLIHFFQQRTRTERNKQ
jgi:hypothetical protein